MLDGLEIYKALTHLLPYDEQDDTAKVDNRGKSPEQVIAQKKQAEIDYYTGMKFSFQVHNMFILLW